MKQRRLYATVVLVSALGTATVATLAEAQTTGLIDGTVADRNGSRLPGVSVEIRSTALPGTRAVVTDGAGRYRFPAVPPGTYTVTASASGFTKTERAAHVALGGTATVPILMVVRTRGDPLVAVEIPDVDVTTTTAGTRYTAEVMSRLPLQRNYADVVRLQPGVQLDNGETQGHALALSIYGSTSAENLYLIDGVDTTNVLKGFQGKPIVSEFVQEVEVQTGGYQAEYGRNTGGVINVITKQGGNEFHGGVFGSYDDASTRAGVKVETTPAYSQTGDVAPSATYPKNTRWDAGLSIGGYLLKDALWFFAGYDRARTDRTIAPAAGPVEGHPFPQKLDAESFSGKLTFRATSSTDVSLSLFGDPRIDTGAVVDVTPVSDDPLTWSGTQKLGGQDLAARATQIFGSWGLATVQYGRHSDRYRRFLPDVVRVIDGTRCDIFCSAVQSGGLGEVSGPLDNNQSVRDAYRGTLSIFLGAHELEAGGDFKKDVTSGSSFFTGGQLLRIYPCQNRTYYRCDLSKAPVVTVAEGTIPVFCRHDFFAAGASDLAAIPQSSFEVPTRSWSWFLQDEWKVLPNLVANAGLRYDDEKVYKGDGSLAFDLSGQWSPRLGLSWDFLNDGSSKLYGSWGRFYGALPTDLSVRVFTATTRVASYNYSTTSTDQDPGSADGFLRQRSIRVGTVAGEPIDSGLRAGYQDELAFGIEKAIDPTFSVGARFTSRRLGRTIEDRCDLDPADPRNHFNSCALINPGGSGPAASGKIATCNGTGNPFDPTAGTCTGHVAVPSAERRYTGLELVARKRAGNSFWAQASYVFSKLDGNYSGAVRTASGQTDPGINADFDYYQFSQNADGLLELDRPHSLRLDTAYTLPFGLETSLGFKIRSGVPINKQGWFNFSYTTELYLSPRGSVGRTPTEWDADITLGYDLHVGPVTITPQFFIFNLFNNQQVTGLDQRFNPGGTFVENGPFTGQPGVEPGTGDCPASAKAPCSDNQDFMKASSVTAAAGRTDPRILRFAIKVNF